MEQQGGDRAGAFRRYPELSAAETSPARPTAAAQLSNNTRLKCDCNFYNLLSGGFSLWQTNRLTDIRTQDVFIEPAAFMSL